MMGTGHGRPNDSRGFIHKKILGLGGKILSTVGSVVPLPGAGILRTVGGLATRLSGAGQSVPTVIGINAQLEQEGFAQSRFPGTDEFQRFAQRKAFGRQADQLSSGNGRNGACPTACAPVKGNRRVNAAGECAPPGFHWNVSGYFRKGGPCSKFQPGFVEEGTVLVKNRRMNNANGQAQTRSLKRIEAGQDHAKRILRATGWRTISKQSSREMRMRRRGSRH